MKRIGIVVMRFGGVFTPSKMPTPEYGALLAVFSPFKTDENYVTGEVIITGYSEAFDILSDSEVIPEYRIEFRQVNNLVLVSNIVRK